MATIKNKNKKGVEAWWGFLAGALIAIAVAILILVLYGKIKIGGESAIQTIGDKIGQIFK